MPKILVLGGEFVHPTTTQFRYLAERAPDGYEFEIVEGPEALERLPEADVFVAAGLYWTGGETVTWTEPVPYRGPNEAQRQALRDYVAALKPILSLHGGIASFYDWPEFGTLLGFAWHWDITSHGPVQEYRVYPTGSSPLTQGVDEFRIVDENYFNVQLVPGASYATHLKMDCGDLQLPMLMTCAARNAAYLALGHDMRAVEHPAFQRLLWNTTAWLLDPNQGA